MHKRVFVIVLLIVISGAIAPGGPVVDPGGGIQERRYALQRMK